jgi:MFS family permease
MSADNMHSPNKTFILVVTTVSAFMGAFIMSSINIALPAISTQFSVNAVVLGWLVNANILASAIVLLPFGKLADTYGRTRFYILGTIVQAATSFLAAFSPDVGWLIAARILHGISGSMTLVAYPAILISTYPSKDRGRVLGINVAAVYTGISLSPFLGGILTKYFGWPSIYVFTGIMISIIAVFLIWKLRGIPETRGPRQPFDYTGAVIFGLSLFVLIFGLSELPGQTGIWSILVAIAGIVLFIWYEMRTKFPLLDVTIFRNNRIFAFSNMAALINYAATAAIAFLLSLYLQYIKGYTPDVAGLIMVAQPAIQAVMSPVAGRLSDKMEPRLLSSLGMAITAAGLVLLIFLNNGTSIAYVLICLVILGFGFGIFSSPNTNAILSSVEVKSYSIANAVLGAFRNVGQMMSLGIATLLFALYIGREEITPQYYPQFLQSTHTAFIIFAALCVAGIFFSLIRGKARRAIS